MKHFLFLLATLFAVQVYAADPIPIKSIVTTKGIDNAYLSFDKDQGTSWFPGWSTDPGECVITFDGEYDISKIRYLDGSGRPQLLFFAGDGVMPFKTILLYNYLVWGEENVKATATSVRIQLHGIQGDKVIPEIVFYGNKVGIGPIKPPTPPTPSVKPIPGVSDKVNLCGFHWTPMDKMKPFKMKRDFQMALWTWPAEGFSPQPLYGAQSATVLGYDDYFAEAKAQGLEIVPCVNETPDWFWNMPESPAMYTTTSIDLPYYNSKLPLIAALDTNEGPPVPLAYSNVIHPKTLPCGSGGQRDDPTSYLEYARYMFQYSARYGRQKWDDNILEVNETEFWPNYPINQKKSGLDLLKYIEPWNEPDAWWLNSDVYATPEQFAAFLSACYDGHGGTMGYGVGIKEADSTMLVVMPGLTGPDKKYLERMVAWFRANRPKGDLAFDIANFHHYSNTTNQAGRWPPTWTAGAPADCDNAWIDVVNFVNYAKSLGVPVWWSEMGYDSKPPSWQYAVPYKAISSEQLQADWLVRNYLMGIRAGIDQIFMFNAINEPGAPNGGLYQNSGLLYGAGDVNPFAPKPSYNSVVNLINQLKGYSYVKDESLGDKVMLLKFQGPKKHQVKYVAWVATMDGTSRTVRVNGTRYNITETPTFINSLSTRQVLIKPNWIERNKVIGQRPEKPIKPK